MKAIKELLCLVVRSFMYEHEVTCNPGDILCEVHKLRLSVQPSNVLDYYSCYACPSSFPQFPSPHQNMRSYLRAVVVLQLLPGNSNPYSSELRQLGSKNPTYLSCSSCRSLRNSEYGNSRMEMHQ